MQGLFLIYMVGSRALCTLMGVKSLQNLCIASGWVLERPPGCSLLPTVFGRVLPWGKPQAGITGASGVRAADCHSHRHRQLGRQRHEGSMGCGTRTVPACCGARGGSGNRWGQERGIGGTSICREAAG